MLTIRNLSKTYRGGVKALVDVSLDIPNGMFGLLGPNGAGKSTLMRTIAGLQEPDQGTITLQGIDVVKEKDRVRRILGYLPQEFGVYPRISAYAMLDHFAVLKGIADRKRRKEVVEGLLKMVNLYDVRRRYLTTFSGGMRQRFGIAQALIGDPKLVIVDEPTAGLDPEERNRFLNLLGEIGENIVVILSTHIVDDVAELCGELAIISEGRVRSRGKPAELMQELRGRIFGSVIERGDLERCEREYNVISSRFQGGKMVIHVIADKPPSDSFEELAPDLEDVYFATLQGPASGKAAA